MTGPPRFAFLGCRLWISLPSLFLAGAVVGALSRPLCFRPIFRGRGLLPAAFLFRSAGVFLTGLLQGVGRSPTYRLIWGLISKCLQSFAGIRPRILVAALECLGQRGNVIL